MLERGVVRISQLAMQRFAAKDAPRMVPVNGLDKESGFNDGATTSYYGLLQAILCLIGTAKGAPPCRKLGRWYVVNFDQVTLSSLDRHAVTTLRIWLISV